jgi:hypothetical protein
MAKKTVTVTMDSDLKHRAEHLAKERGTTVAELVRELLINEISNSLVRPSVPGSSGVIPGKDGGIINSIKRIGAHHAEGAIPVKSKPDAPSVIYLPEAWYFSLSELAKITDSPRFEIDIALNGTRGYRAIWPKKRDKKTRDTIRKIMKTLELYGLTGKKPTVRSVIERIFNKHCKDGLILVKELEPLSLAKFCEKNPEKKVICLLD